jgi:hypothetical protein
LQIVRTVAALPADLSSGGALYEDVLSRGSGKKAREPEEDEEEDDGDGFGMGLEAGYGGGVPWLPDAPSAGEAPCGPDGGCEWLFEPTWLPPDPDAPRVARVIGYIPGSPLTKELLAGFLGQERFSGMEAGVITLEEPRGGGVLKVKTTLDPELQREAEKWTRASGALEAALVAVDPLTGKVVVLAGGGSRAKLNPAVAGSFPAASVFKIVTAAAAIELNGYTQNHFVRYDGGRHTLYRANVAKEPNRGRHKASLRDGFSHSINSVFGKLGLYTIGADRLREWAELFRFNSPMPFEMEVTPSSFQVENKDDSLMLAGLSSGYNRATKISPLHAAVLTASVYSDGMVYEPYLAAEASGGDGGVLYQGAPKELGRAMRPETARELRELMRASVYEGTGRKRFWDAQTHGLLKGLDLGGKSGTINDSDGNFVDWFVALSSIKGKDGAGARPLALAAVVLHRGKPRTSSQELVRRAVLRYYGPDAAQQR